MTCHGKCECKKPATRGWLALGIVVIVALTAILLSGCTKPIPANTGQLINGRFERLEEAIDGICATARNVNEEMFVRGLKPDPLSWVLARVDCERWDASK